MRLSYEPKLLRRVREAREFGRVAVLFGGDSSEREISLLTGNAVLQALKARGVDAHAFDPRERALEALRDEHFERVWIALHGPGGEDGTLQGALEYLGVPYTGSGVMGSAIGMDKLRTKRLALAVGRCHGGLRGAAAGRRTSSSRVERLRLPLIVKPATQGSSVGMTSVEHAAELPAAYAAAAEFEPCVFAEPWITGREYTVAILQGRALPSIRIETPRTFYDYEAKYFRDDTRYFCPSGSRAGRRGALGESRARGLRGLRRLGLGPRGFHDGRQRAAAAAGDQHRARHDRVTAWCRWPRAPPASTSRSWCWRVLETSFTRAQVAHGEGERRA